MSADESKQKGGKNTTAGVIGIVIGLAVGFFTYAHRPLEGFVDGMNRGDTWWFTPGPYSVLLFLAALCGLAGILRIVTDR